MKRIFKLSLLALIIIIFSLSLIEITKDNPSLIIKNLINKNLESKTFVLKLKALGIIPVGIARIEDLGIESFGKEKVYHLKATAQTLDYFSKLFNARAEADSYVDIKKMHSLKFVQRVETPGKYDYNRDIIYDQKRKIMKIKDTEREILDNTQDPLSAIFYIRHQKFQKDKEFSLNINTNQKNYLLSAKVLDYDEINVNNQKIGIWLLSGEVRRHGKSPRHKTSVKIWFLDNKAKTPILIRVMTAGGLITARLVDVK